MRNLNLNLKRNKGFVALTAIILINAILLFVISSLTLHVIDDSDIVSSREQSVISRYLAQTCIEKALIGLIEDPNSGRNLTEYMVDDGELINPKCTYLITGDFPQKIIEAKSEYGDQKYTSKIDVFVSTTNPKVKIESINNFVD